MKSPPSGAREITCQCSPACDRTIRVRFAPMGHAYYHVRHPRPPAPEGKIAECEFFGEGQNFAAVRYRTPNAADLDLLAGAERLERLTYRRV
jgi:hypothetical protein